MAATAGTRAETSVAPATARATPAGGGRDTAAPARAVPDGDRGRAPAAAAKRDLRLDFFRGLALMFIFVDHIPQNFFSYFTLQAIGFYDAAEVFIFISGFTAALVYSRTWAGKGGLFASVQVLRRTWQLYVAHVFLFVIFIAEVSYTVMKFNNPMYNEETRVGDFLAEPHIAVIKALLLQFQPTFLDILPLYIVLLGTFPLVLALLRLRPALALIPSFLLYLAVQVWGLAVPAYPEGHVWYFNPLAWQFLFVAGAVLGHAQAEGRLAWRQWRRVLFPAAILFAVALVVRVTWTLHGLWDGMPQLLLKQLWPINKTNLSPIRLVPFFALVAIVAAWVPADARFLRAAAARPLVRCGRQSLEIFCLSILLSALGHFVLSEYGSQLVMQTAVTVTGIVIMCLTARMIDWYKIAAQAPPSRPAGSASGAAG